MARYLFNPSPDYSPTSDADLAAPMEFHRKLPGYAPSPLLEAPAIASRLNVGSVWIKDESQRLGLPSFKILGASWGTYRALDRHVGGLPPWETLDDLAQALDPYRPLALAAATDGNHGHAVAVMARLLRLEARIFVPQNTAVARVEAIREQGASCEIVEGDYERAVARSAREASDDCLVISDTSWDGYEDVPAWVIEGYSTIFVEIDQQLGDLRRHVPDLMTVQVGVGALAAAAARHFRHASNFRMPVMIAVEPEDAACMLLSMLEGRLKTVRGPHTSIMAGLNCGTPSRVAWPVVSKSFDAFMAISDDRAREGMKVLSDEGFRSGETGAAGIAGLLEFLTGLGAEERRARFQINEATSILVLSTEGITDPEAYEELLSQAPA